jgi:ribonuclease BN (tRNA processing enzyme)
VRVTFWGTRGSLVSSGPAYTRYGGNTPCLQLECGGGSLVLDWGAGIIGYSRHLMSGAAGPVPDTFHLLSSHLHWDHVLGLPFFTPIYKPGVTLNFYGACAERLQLTVERTFNANYSPIKGTKNLGAELRYHTIDAPAQVAGFRVSGARVCHVPRTNNLVSRAWRLEADGRAVVYATDHEGGRDPAVDEGLVRLCEGADLLIHDAQFTPAEYPARMDWGHSPYDQAVRAAAEAGVPRLALFHHAPFRTDDELDALLEAARALAPAGLEIFAARDEQRLEL